MAPFYDWPPRFGPSLRYALSAWSPIGIRFPFVVTAIVSWLYFSPALERCREFGIDWMAQIWLRNFALTLLITGGLHLFLYTFRRQGNAYKYDPRDLSRQSKRFHFNNQVWDNMFWTLVSAVTIASLYESVLMWAYANGHAPLSTFSENPLWFIALLFVLPWWEDLHFYCQHRLLHVRALFRFAHHWHHRNSNTGPWSGASMHPLEHVFWLSDVLLFLFIASHPIHVIYLLHYQVMGAGLSHSGYEKVVFSKRFHLQVGDFFHQLHHRYRDCNYGSVGTPWDRWLGTYHDGTERGDAWIKERRLALTKPATSA